MGLVSSALVTGYQGVNSYTDNSTNVITGGAPRFKTGYILVGDTADATNTIAVDLYAQFGISRFLGFKGYLHGTANSAIAPETDTTAVVNNTLTVTLAAGSNNKKRTIVVYGI